MPRQASTKKRSTGASPYSQLARNLMLLRHRISELPKASRDKIKEILHHSRNANIKLVGKQGFRVGQQGSSMMFTGLTKRLHAQLWPDFDEDPRSDDNKKRKKAKQAYYVPTGTPKIKCKDHGAKHGTRVHSELHRFIQAFTKGRPIHIPRTYDPCTIRVLNEFVAKQWIPVASELPIWNEEIRVATAIDFICVDANTGKVVLGELKTGVEGQEYGRHPMDKPLRAPMPYLYNSPETRNSLQVLGTLLILDKSYKWLPDEAYIIRPLPRQQTTAVLTLPKWAAEKKVQSDLYVALMSR